MATISAYDTKNGKRYRVRYRTPDRRQTDKRGFTSKRAAQDWLAQNTVDINTGTWRKPTKITLNTAAKTWLKTKLNIGPNTKKAYESSIVHIRAHTIGGTYTTDITRKDVEAWVAHLLETLSPKTVHNDFDVLYAIMQRAVEDKHVPANPCIGVALPKVPQADRRFLTAGEVEQIAAKAGAYGDHIRFMAYTGLRWGEFAGLKFHDVDLERGRLHVRRQLSDRGGRLKFLPPKFDKHRLVPLIGPAARIVREKMEGKNPDDLVFTTSRGASLRYNNARRDWFDPAVEKAGQEGLTPHELRHTFASVAISSGASIKALQTALGHHSAAFTLDVYGHLFPDDYDSFINAMSLVFTANSGQNVGTEVVGKEKQVTQPGENGV